jgi:thioredoxin-dependent peroxiredoxin
MAFKLNIGDKLPNLIGINQNNEQVSLNQFIGKKLVLFFYPKDNTPGCTAEVCNLRDNYEHFLANGFEVLGVSPDTVEKHQKFIAKHNLPFNLIADVDLTFANAFGVWGEKSLYGKKYMGLIRTTFVFNNAGELENIIEKVKTKDHSAQIL